MGYLNNFAFEELDANRSLFTDMTKTDFIATYKVSDEAVVRFEDYLNLRERTKITFAAYHDVMKQLIKAGLGDQLYGGNTYEQIINAKDDMVNTVIEISETVVELE